MASSLHARVLDSIRRGSLLRRDDRVAVAVSGGSDSVALTFLLHELARASHRGWTVAGLIHVNHGLRGDEAERDESFVRALAARLGHPVEVGRVDVAAEARAARQSLEAAARRLRYRILEDAARRLDATVVATGHTLDDQAETVLLRLLRGAGLRGLAGIRARRGVFIRPLLDCPRRELRRFLAEHAEPHCEDSTNADTAIPRNLLRRDLMPVIERLAPGGVAALGRLAALAEADEAFLEARAIELAADVVLSDRNGVQLNRAALVGLPVPLARRLIRRLLEQGAPGTPPAARHVEAVRDLAGGGRQDGHLDLPGVAVQVRGPEMWLWSRGHAGSREVRPGPGNAKAACWPSRTLDVPGEVEVPEAGVVLRATCSAAAIPASASGETAVLQEGTFTRPLQVRNRLPGDWLRPLGAPGRRKLQDVLVDRKVPRAVRDAVPLVVDGRGHIVWVVGLTIAEECRVRSQAAGMVVLNVVPVRQ